MRKRVKREQKKLKLEPLQTPSTSPQTTIARYLVNQVRSNAGQLDKDTWRKLKSTSQNPGKWREVLYETNNKFCEHFNFKAKRGKEKDKLSNEKLKSLRVSRPSQYLLFESGEIVHAYVGRKDGVKVYEQKCYLLWKIRDLHEIASGGSGVEEAGGDSFSNTFGRPLKFALLCVLKLYKE